MDRFDSHVLFSESIIPGEIIKGDSAVSILERVRYWCNWKVPTFPGSQPVSLTASNLTLISKKGYVACEKTDGVRFLLYSLPSGVFLIDRKEIVRKIDLFLPLRDDPTKPHTETLLDGELVLDTVACEPLKADEESLAKPLKKQRFLIYDAVVVDKEPVKHYNLLHRLKKVATDVIQPYVSYYENKPKPLEIFLKDFFDITEVDSIHEITTKLPHPSDGIIFTPINKPYAPGTCKELLKWKPPHLNTVDFAAEMMYDSKDRPRLINLLIAERGIRTPQGIFAAPYGDVYKSFMQEAILNPSNRITQTIVECYWAPGHPVYTFVPAYDKAASSDIERPPCNFEYGNWVEGGWVIERVRTDKHMPNDKRVVDKVFQSIQDGITFQHLMSEFSKYSSHGKKHCSHLCLLPSYYETEQHSNQQSTK